MVALLRAVTTSAPYRHIRGRLQSREPDDVWYEPDVGWMLAFALQGPAAEGLALFMVRQPGLGARAEIVRAIEIDRDGGQAEVRPLLVGP